MTTTTTTASIAPLQIPKYIKNHELVGLEVTVIDSSNQDVIGLNGRVEYETKSMLQIKTSKQEIKFIPKNTCVLEFDLNGTLVVIDGVDIAKRSFDRIVTRGRNERRDRK